MHMFEFWLNWLLYITETEYRKFLCQIKNVDWNSAKIKKKIESLNKSAYKSVCPNYQSKDNIFFLFASKLSTNDDDMSKKKL